uniref:Uncharacterized protein n=1 Tax=Anguilla anguilla TaxID=7936 RepID=A0A0E9S447_ANGAN
MICYIFILKKHRQITHYYRMLSAKDVLHGL